MRAIEHRIILQKGQEWDLNGERSEHQDHDLPACQRTLCTSYIQDGPDTFMIEENSARNGDVLFRVKLNGSPVVGYGENKWDKIHFSSYTKAAWGKVVLIHRFQLPTALRSRGIGTRILKILLDMYRMQGCLQIVVAFPTNQGRGLYTKLGFVRASSRDPIMHLHLVEKTNQEALRTTSVDNGLHTYTIIHTFTNECCPAIVQYAHMYAYNI